MFQGRLHKNYAAIQAAVLQAEAAAGQASGLGTPNFWYDGSLYQYVIPSGTANTTNYTTLNLLSKFQGGPGLAIKYFGFVSTNASNPDYYISYNAFNSKVVNTFTAYIATGTAVTAQGTITTSSITGQSLATLTVSTQPANGLTIGAAISGGNLPANSWIFSTATNTTTYYITNSSGLLYANSATTATFTVTPVIMTVTTSTGGIMSQGNIIRANTPATISATLTQVTRVISQGTNTGTFYLSQPQTQGSAGSPLSGYYAHMPSFNFNSNDGFRVAMTGSNVLTGYTWIMTAKLGSTAGLVGILSTDHNFNNTTASGTTVIGEGMYRNGSTLVYKAAGSTATGITFTTSSWGVYSGVYDGTQATPATRFQARYNGTASTLTFYGTPTTATLNPGLFTFTASNITSIVSTGSTATITVTSPNSQFYNVGQSITLAGWTVSGTQGSINGTQTVTACTTNSVSFAVTGTVTTATVKGTISGTPIVNLYVDGNPPTAYGSAPSNANATTNGLELGELIWFNSALGTTAVQAFESYLSNKWLGK